MTINDIIKNDLANQAMDLFVIPKKTRFNKGCFSFAYCIRDHPSEVIVTVPLPDSVYEECELCGLGAGADPKAVRSQFVEVIFDHVIYESYINF